MEQVSCDSSFRSNVQALQVQVDSCCSAADSIFLRDIRELKNSPARRKVGRKIEEEDGIGKEKVHGKGENR
jgi:hypothetical protein